MRKITKAKFLDLYDSGMITEVFTTIHNGKWITVARSVEGQGDSYEVVYTEVGTI